MNAIFGIYAIYYISKYIQFIKQLKEEYCNAQFFPRFPLSSPLKQRFGNVISCIFFFFFQKLQNNRKLHVFFVAG